MTSPCQMDVRRFSDFPVNESVSYLTLVFCMGNQEESSETLNVKKLNSHVLLLKYNSRVPHLQFLK